MPAAEHRATFSKRERMVSKRLIEKLFGGGNRSMTAFPLRVVCMQQERQQGAEPVQVLVSVSKRHFKHAVKRNRVKRQVREAYRLNKRLLVSRVPADRQMAVAFIWLADDLQDSERVERSVKRLLGKVAESV